MFLLYFLLRTSVWKVLDNDLDIYLNYPDRTIYSNSYLRKIQEKK